MDHVWRPVGRLRAAATTTSRSRAQAFAAADRWTRTGAAAVVGFYRCDDGTGGRTGPTAAKTWTRKKGFSASHSAFPLQCCQLCGAPRVPHRSIPAIIILLLLLRKFADPLFGPVSGTFNRRQWHTSLNATHVICDLHIITILTDPVRTYQKIKCNLYTEHLWFLQRYHFRRHFTRLLCSFY